MKQYNGEKCIISLTSWVGRIANIGPTLFSLLKQGNDFHIVLTLTIKEFPNKEADLPEAIKLFVDNNLIEILWIEEDYKVFMKSYFTMEKYQNVPVISADDDVLYQECYAEKLYQKWLENKDCIISNGCEWYAPYIVSRGQNTLMTYDIMKNAIDILKKAFNSKHRDLLTRHPEDDAYNAAFYYLYKVKVISLNLPQLYSYLQEQNSVNALHNRITYKGTKSVDMFVEVIKDYV